LRQSLHKRVDRGEERAFPFPRCLRMEGQEGMGGGAEAPGQVVGQDGFQEVGLVPVDHGPVLFQEI